MAKQIPTPADSLNKPAADMAQGPQADEPISKASLPEPRRDGGLAWLVLLGLVILAAVPLGIELQRPATWTQREALATAISAETLARKTPINDGQTSLDAWTPVYEGESRWDLAPGGIWLHQVMYLGQKAKKIPGENRATDHWLLTRARIGSILMALLFVATVYWAGHSIGGVMTGTLSALTAMTMPLLVGFGRHATADSAAIACSTLSIAGALWAMRPLRATPSLTRQLIGWLVCGIGLGLATLVAGPKAIPATVLCTIALAMACPRRFGHIMGLITSTSIAALMLTPWVLHVHDHDPEIWRAWVGELTPALLENGWMQTLKTAGWRISLSVAACGLWLIWLIPAVSQPFSTSSAGNPRSKMLLGWVWLLLATLLLAFAPGPTRTTGLLIAIAPASVAIGLVMQQFHDLSAEARHARLWLICRWIACTAMIALALALPSLGYLLNHRPELVDWLPCPDQPLLATMHWSFYAGAGVVLLLIAVLACRFAYANHPGRTTASLAVWLIIAYSLAAIPLTRSPLMNTAADPPTGARMDAQP